jgi:hypothetical protein
VGWFIAIAVVAVVAAVYVWSTRGGIRQKSIDDAHSEAMTDREPRPPQDGSQWHL